MLELRRKGRFFLENYLLNTKGEICVNVAGRISLCLPRAFLVLARSILSAVRYRLQIPGVGERTEMASPVFSDGSFEPANPQLVNLTHSPLDDEYLGPVEVVYY